MSELFDYIESFKGIVGRTMELQKRQGKFEDFFNSFNKKPMYEAMDKVVEECGSDSSDSNDLEHFILTWVSCLGKNFETHRYDARNEYACRVCSSLCKAMEVESYPEFQCVEYITNNMHRTLIQTATFVLLYGLYSYWDKWDFWEGKEAMFDVLGDSSSLNGASGKEEIVYDSLKHVPLI